MPDFARGVLDLAKAKRRSPVIVVGARGKPFTLSGFRARFFKLIRELANAGAVGPGLSFHGLRHSMATWLADEEVDLRGIQSILGHESTTMSAHYSRDADRRRAAVAAIDKLERKKISFAKPRGPLAKLTKRRATKLLKSYGRPINGIASPAAAKPLLILAPLQNRRQVARQRRRRLTASTPHPARQQRGAHHR